MNGGPTPEASGKTPRQSLYWAQDHRFRQSLGYGLGAGRRWRVGRLCLVEEVAGFEPAEPLRPLQPGGPPESKSGAISHSATPPPRFVAHSEIAFGWATCRAGA